MHSEKIIIEWMRIFLGHYATKESAWSHSPNGLKEWNSSADTGVYCFFHYYHWHIRGRPLMIWGARRKNWKWFYFFRRNASWELFFSWRRPLENYFSWRRASEFFFLDFLQALPRSLMIVSYNKCSFTSQTSVSECHNTTAWHNTVN